MKKITFILCIMLSVHAIFAQFAKPTIIVKPDNAILLHLQKIALSITPIKGNILDSNKVGFVQLLKTAKNASKWKSVEYKYFMKKVTPYIIALGNNYSIKDGGEKLSADPDDGGEIFASAKMLIKALNAICTDTVCPVCCCNNPPICSNKVSQ